MTLGKMSPFSHLPLGGDLGPQGGDAKGAMSSVLSGCSFWAEVAKVIASTKPQTDAAAQKLGLPDMSQLFGNQGNA